jgi:hypothetical protein
MIEPLAVCPPFEAGAKLGLAGFVGLRLIGRDSLDDSVLDVRDQKTAPAAVVRTANGDFAYFSHGETSPSGR